MSEGPQPSADDEASKTPCVEVTDGRSKGRVFALDKVRGYVVGRLPGAEIHISDPGVSRRHIKLTRQLDGKVIATDMRSTNGLVVNGSHESRWELNEGDCIALGPDAELRFCYRSPDNLGEVSRPAPSVPMLPTPMVPVDVDTTHLLSSRRPKLEDLPLSARQLEVSQQVAKGMTNAEIAVALGISPRTVTSHLDHIYGRLGIGSRSTLTRWIVERGLVEPETPS